MNNEPGAIPDLIAKAFERTNALQTYWAFYSTGVLGLLAFFGNKQRERAISIILAIAFVGFAVANLDALRSVTRQRVALEEVFKQRCSANPSTAECKVALSIQPSSLCAVTLLHVTGDVLVLLGMFVLTRRATPSFLSAAPKEGGD
jgi:hypothetical protein